MRWLWKLITAELEVTLALLMLLGSIVVLSWVYAGTANINVNLTVTSESQEPPPSGGSGTSSPTQPTPTSPTPAASVTLPEKTQPPAVFQLADYTPKVLPHYRDTLLTLYGYNFPSEFQIVIKGKSALFTADYQAGTKVAEVTTSKLTTIQYVIPAKSLPLGEAWLSLQQAGRSISPPAPVWVYDSSHPINLRAQIAQRTIDVTVASGQSANVTIKFKNVGLTPWDYLLQPLHIGTSSPYDRKSRFVHNDWPYNNRTVGISLPPDVKTGETFNATFPIQAPVVKRTTRYTENFALVAEGIAWIPGSNFTVRITVTAPVAVKASKTTTKAAPLATAAIVKPAAPYRIPNTLAIIAAQQDHSWWTSVKSFLARLFGSSTLALLQ